MKKQYITVSIITAIFWLTTLTACHDTDKKKEEKTSQKDVSTNEPSTSTPKRPPIINIVDTVSVKTLVLCMKDSAANSERIGMKIREIHTIKLANIITKNKLTVSGPPMAWYKSHKAPFFFEAGLPVDKRPGKLPKGFFIKEIGVDSVVVAHFTGPYDLMAQGYEALTDWLKSNKKISGGAPYEIYTTDPLDKDGQPKDPYKVQTDIVFPMKNRH